MLKRFFLNILSSFVGTWIAIVLFIIAGIMLVVALMANVSISNGTVETVKSRSILTISLDGPIEEREAPTEPDMMMLMQGRLEKPQTLDVIVQSIREAAKNDDIAMIYLKCGAVGASPATLDAIRSELAKFKESGKRIYAYGDGLSQGSYYVASVADKVFMNPAGELALQGLSTTNLYMKGLFDKLGVQFQVIKVGTYKSAVEPYILENMSEPARAQLDTLLNSMWQHIRTDIASSRKSLTTEKIDSLISRDNIAFSPASNTVKTGFVDSLVYERSLKAIFADITGREADDLNFVSPSTLVAQTPWASEYKSKNQIAVLFACGEIADGNDNAINYEKLVPQIVELAENDDVKGMVLRVNSPGGSVFGSTQIGEALDFFQSKGKTLTVSMGDYAASGGYWISAKADRIFADPLTITGSIGIFGLLPNVHGTLENFGINVATVSTNPGANFPNLFRPLDEHQMAVAQAYIERGYQDFTTRVAEGRHLKIENVLAIAEGRVWAAPTALKIGLVDQLGSLQEAIEWTAAKAGVKDKYAVAAYPKVEPNFWSLVQLNGMTMEQLKAALDAHDFKSIELYLAKRVLSRHPMQARMPEFKIIL